MAVQTVIFHLAIPCEQWLEYHRGRASSVLVRADDGRSLRLPASALRPFASHSGVHGRFALRYAEDHRLLDLRRL